MDCLFVKASTANAGAELLKLRPLLREQQLILINATYSNTERFGSYPKRGSIFWYIYSLQNIQNILCLRP